MICLIQIMRQRLHSQFKTKQMKKQYLNGKPHQKKKAKLIIAQPVAKMCDHLMGKKHTHKHRMQFGFVIMVIGVTIAKVGAEIHFVVVHIFFDLAGYAIHALGWTPFIDAAANAVQNEAADDKIYEPEQYSAGMPQFNSEELPDEEADELRNDKTFVE